MGLIHNDLNPSNIMMDRWENPVIIDFDSCQRQGAELNLKMGTLGWAMEGSVYANRQNDFFGLSKTREILMEGEGEEEYCREC